MKTILLTLGLLVLRFSVDSANASELLRFEEDHSLPVVHFAIVLESGAAQDPANKLGLAQVANRMMLRGTQKREKHEFFEALNQLGGQLAVQVRNEGTEFRASVLSANLKPFLELVTEALTKPKFTSQELAKVKQEVESEILLSKSQDHALVTYHFARFFYGSHPYANPAIGTRNGVKAVTGPDVANYFARYYGKKSLHVFGTGDADTTVIQTWMTDLGDKLDAIHPNIEPIAAVPHTPTPEGRRALIVDKPNATQSQIIFGATSIRPDHPQFYPARLANFTFGGGGFQSRLMQELRVKRGWTYGASSNMRVAREPMAYEIHFFPKTDDSVPAIKLSMDLLKDFTEKGISAAEFEEAKNSLVNSAPFRYDTSQKRLTNLINEFLLGFPDNYAKNFATNIDKVKFDAIVPSLSLAFDNENLVLVIVGDAKKLKPEIAKLPGFNHVHVKNYMED